MAQHGQVLKLRTRRSDGKAVWAYRYRVDGRCSKRPQVGGFATRADAQRALKRTLDHLRPGATITLLASLVTGGAPLTLGKALAVNSHGQIVGHGIVPGPALAVYV